MISFKLAIVVMKRKLCFSIHKNFVTGFFCFPQRDFICCFKFMNKKNVFYAHFLKKNQILWHNGNEIYLQNVMKNLGTTGFLGIFWLQPICETWKSAEYISVWNCLRRKFVLSTDFLRCFYPQLNRKILSPFQVTLEDGVRPTLTFVFGRGGVRPTLLSQIQIQPVPKFPNHES